MALIGFVLALPSCTTLDELDRKTYQSACDNLGIARGTSTYDECMLQQQRMNNENVQRTLDRSNEREIVKAL
jgi:hypothetical protein